MTGKKPDCGASPRTEPAPDTNPGIRGGMTEEKAGFRGKPAGCAVCARMRTQYTGSYYENSSDISLY